MTDVSMKHDKDVQQIPGFLLWQVSKLWQRHLANTFDDLQLTNTQVILLGNIVRLTREGKQVTQTILSDTTKVDVMTTSAVIRTLEKKYFIKRLPHPQDKRAYYVLPTEEGIKKAQQAINKLPSAQHVFFAPIENDIELFIRLMQKLIASNSNR